MPDGVKKNVMGFPALLVLKGEKMDRSQKFGVSKWVGKPDTIVFDYGKTKNLYVHKKSFKRMHDTQQEFT